MIGKKKGQLRLGCLSLNGHGQYVAWGSVYDHPSVNDGQYVRTSPILKVDFIKGILETENTIYELIP